jgi:hypothetical protein
MSGTPIVAIILIVLGAGFIGLAILSPTNDISIEVQTNPPLSVLVKYDPYSGTLTIRGTNQDARPLEALLGIALLVGGFWSLKRSGHLTLT